MPKVNIKTPDWLRRMESILEELNQGVVIVDDQTSHLFSPRPVCKYFLGCRIGCS
jgi:hypothetical protein